MPPCAIAQIRQSLNTAALGKLADTQQLRNVLGQQLADMQAELDEAINTNTSIEEQLMDVDANINRTKAQFIHRTQRPDPEKVKL